MSNISQLKKVQYAPFLTFFTGVVDASVFNNASGAKLEILEVGCGTGDFALLLKSHYQDTVNITAIDISQSEIATAKSKAADSGVIFQNADIFEFTFEKTFDIIVFTKSLHHCSPVEEAISKTHKLLSDGGILISEEIDFMSPDKQTLRWFFDRLDLLCSAGAINLPDASKESHSHAHSHAHSHTPHDTHSHTHSHTDHDSSHKGNHLIKLFNRSLPVQDRWITHERHDLESLSSIQDAITAQFGGDHTQSSHRVPFFYQFLHFAGLKDNEYGHGVIAEFLSQEDNAITTGTIIPVGINIVAKKHV